MGIVTSPPNIALQPTSPASPPPRLSFRTLGGRKLLSSSLPPILLAAGLLASCASAARSAPDYDRSLSLIIKPAHNGVQIGDSVEVRFVLENVSSGSVSGCLTDRNGYTWRGPADLKQKLELVDHNYCQHTFVLGAGQTREWSEQVAVLDVGFGEVKLQAWVQVVDQRSCDRYGCDGRYVHSNQVPFNVGAF